MNISEYSRMQEMEDHYWWHVGRENIIKKQFQNLTKGKSKKDISIINVGAGACGIVPLLEKFGEVTNTDVSDEAIKYSEQRGYKVIRTEGVQLPFPDDSFDMAVAFDVLEHIEDDRGALSEWNRVLKPGGVVLVTVPAYQWLWSDHDESLHHYRRYTAAGLHRLMNLVGFHVIKRSYAIVFSFPLIVGFRVVKGMFGNKEKSTSYVMLPRPINNFFVNILRVEGSVLKRVSMPFGTSVLMAARKVAKIN